MRISDWSSDVCSSDLHKHDVEVAGHVAGGPGHRHQGCYAGTSGQVQQLGRRMTDRCKAARRAGRLQAEIGSASCRERVCQYVLISVVAVALKNKAHDLIAQVSTHVVIVQT